MCRIAFVGHSGLRLSSMFGNRNDKTIDTGQYGRFQPEGSRNGHRPAILTSIPQSLLLVSLAFSSFNAASRKHLRLLQAAACSLALSESRVTRCAIERDIERGDGAHHRDALARPKIHEKSIGKVERARK